MDEKIQILLGSLKNVNSINVDNYIRIELTNKVEEITEYNINNTLSASDVFDAERETSEIYRIYGKIEYFSLLNNLKNNGIIPTLNDFFIPYYPSASTLSNTSKTLLNSFKFSLLRPSNTGYTNITIDGDNTYYIRDFIKISDDIDIYPAGYSNNVFNEQTYCFNVNEDVNIENFMQNISYNNYTGGTGLPVTELYLFAEYNQDQNNTKKYTIWNSTGGSSTINYDSSTNVYRDIIKFSKDEFTIDNYLNQIHYITTKFDQGYLEWKYNPLIPVKLRYFNDSISTANINDVSYEETSKIPYYALKENDPPLIDNGKRIWRDILPQGYIDPISNIGVNYPFVNNRRYLFSNIILDIIPNLSDTGSTTYNVFKNLNFYDPNIIYIQPISGLNNLGQPC